MKMQKTNFSIKRVLNVALWVHCMFLAVNCFSQGAAINTTGNYADASAMLDVSSDNAGILIPRMTKAQRNGISLPAEGLMIYQTDDTTGFWYYNGSLWKQIGTASGVAISAGTSVGNTLYWDGTNWVESSNIYNSGNSVGIGTNSPEPTALIDMNSTTKGALIPRMTTAERNVIANPAEGLQIFNLSTKCFEFYADSSWQSGICSFKCGIDKLTDKRDNNTYQTIKIGTQCWMKENLRYLPVVHSNSGFQLQGNNILPGYGVYGYDGSDINTAKLQPNYYIYGVLYNWYAAMDGLPSSSSNPSGVKGACPDGWHLPSDDEWKQMEKYLGMSQVQADAVGDRGTDEGGKMKEIGTVYWLSPNNGATNVSGFTGLPGGNRSSAGSFGNLSCYGFWWCATDVYVRYLYYNITSIFRGISTETPGYSVRCVKD